MVNQSIDNCLRMVANIVRGVSALKTFVIIYTWSYIGSTLYLMHIAVDIIGHYLI